MPVASTNSLVADIAIGINKEGGWQAAWFPYFCNLAICIHQAVDIYLDFTKETENGVFIFCSVDHDNR